MQGYGVLLSANGKRYEGDMQEDEPSGTGKLTWPNG